MGETVWRGESGCIEEYEEEYEGNAVEQLSCKAQFTESPLPIDGVAL